MRTYNIHCQNKTCKVLIGESIDNLSNYHTKTNTLYITDSNIYNLYSDIFSNNKTFIIPAGEKSKNIETVTDIYDFLLQNKANRNTILIGIGGGVVTDITGFVGSTFMRGIRFGFVATSLLAQVDAAIGGKNGINFNHSKNIIGSFNQPDFVLCDLNILKSLPQEELESGFAEMLKHMLIADKNMFDYFEKNYDKALKLDLRILTKLIYNSVIIKAEIVTKDEKEKGERRKLNFGHTYGHAVELKSGISHGKAVAIGMVKACKISVKYKTLSSNDSKRIISLITNLNLPTNCKIPSEEIVETLNNDKKREQNFIRYVLLNGIGSADIKSIPLKDFSDLF